MTHLLCAEDNQRLLDASIAAAIARDDCPTTDELDAGLAAWVQMRAAKAPEGWFLVDAEGRAITRIEANVSGEYISQFHFTLHEATEVYDIGCAEFIRSAIDHNVTWVFDGYSSSWRVGKNR